MRNFKIVLFLLIVISGPSCKKDESANGAAALNIFNGVTNVSSLYAYLTFSDSAFYLHQSSVAFGSTLEYGVPNGSIPLTLVNVQDTSRNLFQTTLRLGQGGIYSLYLSGQSPAVDTLLVRDTIPFLSDSVSGVRFVNLSGGGLPISVNMAGNTPSQIEFAGLGYRQISPFKIYRSTSNISSYSFEIRDQKTGNLLTTYNWNFAVFKCNTLVICGSADSTSSVPIGVFQINNY